MPDNTGAYVIGVNDAWKFGKQIDELCLINRPRHFQMPALYSECSRLDVIKETKIKRFTTLTTLVREWSEYFPLEIINTIGVTRYRKSVTPGQIYHTENSPFSAMSLAVNYGYDEIVLWGVDFIDHPHIKAVNAAPPFNQFAFSVKDYCKIYKGNSMSNLNLPVWQPRNG